MAATLKLYVGSVEKLDLLDTGVSGTHILEGWVPTIVMPTGDGSIPPYVTERIPIQIRGNGDVDNIATELQTIAEVAKAANEYWLDPTVEDPAWLYQTLETESNSRRWHVKSLTFVPAESAHAPNVQLGDEWVGDLLVGRHPYCEAPSLRSLPQATVAAGLLHYYDPTAAGTAVGAHDIVGDTGARIQRMLIGMAAGDDIGRFWMGLRSANKHGTLTSFETLWECESGTNNGNESGITDHPDVDASGGSCVQVVETDLNWDNEWHEVCMISTSDIVAVNAEDENLGTFLGLLRAQVTSGTWEVQLRYGYAGMNDDDLVKGQTLELTNTTWDIFETDIYTVPMRNLKCLSQSDLLATFDSEWSIFAWAQRTSGSGSIELDCIVPLPVDEGYCVLKDIVGTGDKVYLGTSARDEVYALSVDSSNKASSIASVDAYNFRLPPGDCRIVIVWAGPSDSDITDDLTTINGSDWGKYAERWSFLRGGE